MYQSIPTLGVIAGFAAMWASANDGNAVSPEAQAVRAQAASVVKVLQQSQALFGPKAEAISQLMALAAGEQIANPISVLLAEQFVRVLPNAIPLPEFSIDPDGSISLDWIKARNQIFSLSVGANSRLAFAWLDGTDKGHAVARFDGQRVPERVIEGITSIATNGNASLLAA
jgi:hypothetical protein